VLKFYRKRIATDQRLVGRSVSLGNTSQYACSAPMGWWCLNLIFVVMVGKIPKSGRSNQIKLNTLTGWKGSIPPVRRFDLKR